MESQDHEVLHELHNAQSNNLGCEPGAKMAHTEAKARRVAVKCLVSTRQEWNVRDPKSARTIVSFITPRHPDAAIAPSSVSAMFKMCHGLYSYHLLSTE